MVRYISSLGISKHVNSDVEIITDPNLRERIFDSIANMKCKFTNIFKKNKKIDDDY